MNKSILFSLIFLGFLLKGITQNNINLNVGGPKTLLLEKIGTRHRYSYETGDLIKLRTKNGVIRNTYLWDITDSSVFLDQNRPLFLREIMAVYPQFRFPRKFGSYMFLAGVAYFMVVSFDHLINKEIVLTKDVFIVPTALFGVGLISVSLSQKRCKIGDNWKLKVLTIRML
jgi:hypothetical protein